MSHSSVSEHFYTGDDSIMAEMNETLESAIFPLKKLPTQSVNEVRNNISLHQANIPSNKIDSKVQLIPVSNPNITGTFKPLSDSHYKVGQQFSKQNTDQNDLFKRGDNNSVSDEMFYYRSGTSNGATLSKDFFPPVLPHKVKNPIIAYDGEQMRNLGKTSTEFDELDDSEDYSNTPTGEWMSPVVKAALQRQVNKEQQFQVMWKNLAYLFACHMGFLLIDQGFKLYWLLFYDMNEMYKNPAWSNLSSQWYVQQVCLSFSKLYSYLRHVRWLFVLVVIYHAVKLAWPQDQCYDLPLTAKQRVLIGLRPLSPNEATDDYNYAGLIAKQRFEKSTDEPLKVPKYTKTNEFVGYLRRTGKERVNEEAAIALQDVIPQRRLLHSGPQRNAEFGIR